MTAHILLALAGEPCMTTGIPTWAYLIGQVVTLIVCLVGAYNARLGFEQSRRNAKRILRLDKDTGELK